MNRRIFAAVAIVALLAVSVGGFLLTREHITPVSVSQQFTASPALEGGTRYGDDTVLFFNAGHFVAYNYKKGDTVVINPANPIYDLAAVDSLSVSKDKAYVVFHTDITPENSPLSAALAGQNPDEPFGYWWVLNTKNQSFTPLPTGTLQVRFGDSTTIHALIVGDDKNESIATLNAETGQQISRIQIPKCADFFPAGKSFLLQLPNNDVLLTTDGTVNETIFSSVLIAHVLPGGERAIGIEVLDDKQKLVELHIPNRSMRVIASDVLNLPVATDTGVAYLTPSENRATNPPINYYDFDLKKKFRWEYTAAVSALAIQDLHLAELLDKNVVLAADSSGNARFVGTGLAEVKTPDKAFGQIVSGASQLMTVSYISDPSSFIISYATPPLSATDRQAAVANLQAAGYNPYLLGLTFNLTDTD